MSTVDGISEPTPASGALSGITVVDFSRQMSGPYASLVLGDFGADIIKIESTPNGDPSRTTGQYFIEGESTMFLTWNRNKRSVCIDLHNPEGLAVARRLIEQADVLIENYRPGVADEIGVGWDVARELNPRLIYCSVNAFGSKGPWRDRPGTDPVVQAVSGVMSVTGEPDGGPVLVGIPIADYTGSMLAVQGILLAIASRYQTGKGQFVEIPMIGALLFGLTTRIGPYFLTGEDPTRWGSQHSQVVPYQAFPTKDGWAVVGVWGDGGWTNFCEALGWPELAEEERFNTNIKRVNARDELSVLLNERFKERTTAQWEGPFVERHVLFSPVNSFSEALNHPQVKSMNFVTEVEHPTAGTLQQIAPVIRLSGTPASIRLAPPLLGQHTTEVLLERGWGHDEIESLLASGAIMAAKHG